MSEEQKRNLKIKCGAVKRTTKEYLYYFQEKERENVKLEKMRTEAEDAYDIKQQENVVQESLMMIPETKKSLEGLLSDLKQVISDIGDALPADGEEMTQAADIVKAADEALNK